MKNRYYREAQSSVNERYSNFTGDELGNLQFAGDNSFAGDFNASGAQQSAPARDSKPYEVQVANSTGGALTAFLWGSNIARTTANFNNPVGITITSATPGISYLQMLADSEAANFEIGKTYMEVTAGSNSALTKTWSLTYKNSDGKVTTDPLPVKINPMQQVLTVLEFYYTFPLDGYTSIAIDIPANTTIVYSYYVAATNRPGRNLLNQAPIREFKDSPIVRPTPIALTPRAIQQLTQGRR